MSLPTEKLLTAVVKIPAVKKMQASVKTSLKCGAFVGAVTALSGVLGGPIGLALGGAISSGIAAYTNKGNLTSVPFILLYETTNGEKEKLGKILRSCLNTHNIHNMYELVEALSNNENLVNAVVAVVITFLSSEMGQNVLT